MIKNLYDLPEDILIKIFFDVHKYKFKDTLTQIKKVRYTGSWFYNLCVYNGYIMFIVILP